MPLTAHDDEPDLFEPEDEANDASTFAKPASLDRPSGFVWRKTIAQLQEQGTFQESDLPAVERYCLALQRARVARQESGGELVSIGSKLQPVESPWVKIIRDAEQDAARYARDLL